MDFRKVVENRYSCKSFDGRKVEQAILDRILEAGRVAPTAKNLQEQHIYVLQSDEALEKVDMVTPCRYMPAHAFSLLSTRIMSTHIPALRESQASRMQR